MWTTRVRPAPCRPHARPHVSHGSRRFRYVPRLKSTGAEVLVPWNIALGGKDLSTHEPGSVPDALICAF
ncbi:hypothetical protein VTI74DRAFT_9339 [Chaetomium olivicolor]